MSDRGAAQFGGGVSFYYPGAFGDASNKYSLTYDAMDQPRTLGYITVRIDGEQLNPLAAAGDLVNVYHIMTDGYAESIVGEEAFRYTVTMLPQGDVYVRTVVKGASAPVVATPATLAVAVGASSRLSATVDGRVYTNGVKWSSADGATASVSPAGVVTGVAAGTVVVTATYEATGGTDTTSVTVS